jgi:hypothetical protein
MQMVQFQQVQQMFGLWPSFHPQMMNADVFRRTGALPSAATVSALPSVPNDEFSNLADQTNSVRPSGCLTDQSERVRPSDSQNQNQERFVRQSTSSALS